MAHVALSSFSLFFREKEIEKKKKKLLKREKRKWKARDVARDMDTTALSRDIFKLALSRDMFKELYHVIIKQVSKLYTSIPISVCVKS